MIVCVCKAVSERHIRQALKEGMAETFDDLQIDLGLATCCGKCESAARAMVETHQTVERARQEEVPRRIIPIMAITHANPLNMPG
ncbi:(2Fe-2S)-binding protein [Ampullimonas aquatilis]|uniref:(2Fe-2S)-binding protein n=1 Tax=Ampullimonas aquatilis TaxID=1341549 RepID=UPI003C753541